MTPENDLKNEILAANGLNSKEASNNERALLECILARERKAVKTTGYITAGLWLSILGVFAVGGAFKLLGRSVPDSIALWLIIPFQIAWLLALFYTGLYLFRRGTLGSRESAKRTADLEARIAELSEEIKDLKDSR